MKKYFFSAVFFGIFAQTFSQKNVSKASFFPESVYRTFGFAQERALSKKISLQTTFRIMATRQFADAKYAGGSYRNDMYNPFSDTKASSFGNVTELRIYSKKRGVMKGFYYGPYASFNRCNITTGVYAAKFKINNCEYAVDMKQAYSITTVGGGLQMGVQMLLKKRIVVDWTMLGIGFGSLALKGRISTLNTPDNFDLREFPADPRNSEFAFEKYYPIKKTVEEKSISISGKKLVPFFRMCIAVGIAY